MSTGRSIAVRLAVIAVLVTLLTTPLTMPVAHAATLTVTTTADNTTDDGACTLREAILAANGTPANDDCGAGSAGLDTIAFNIPSGQCGADGVCIIILGSNLPTVTEAVTIDGTTQPRYGTAPANVCATSSAPSYMRVEIRGGGLYINHAAGSSTVRGLSLVDPAAESLKAALRIQNGSGHRVQCNHIGVNGPGTAGVGTTTFGVIIEMGASDVIIGTDGDGSDDLAERNVFGALAATGVYINSNYRNVIAGNYFGFGANGTTPLAIGNDAVFIRQDSGLNRVGTNWDGISDELERNIIGNVSNGVEICSFQSAGTNSVVGNWIGLDAAGAAATCSRGVYLNTSSSGSPTYTIIDSNTIGHCTTGIQLEGEGVDNTVITSNFIGVTPEGASIGAGMNLGIRISSGADLTEIGNGTLEGANFIGNTQIGIQVQGNNSTTGTKIDRNFIGVGPGGVDAGNATAGILFMTIQAGDTGNAARRNVIGFNGTGVAIDTFYDPAAQIEITDNFIGTDSPAAFANYANTYGLIIQGATTSPSAHLVKNNLFAYGNTGVRVSSIMTFAAGSTHNCIVGNTTGFYHGSTVLNLPFENNWWGAADGPSGVGPGSGDSVVYASSGTLDFTPWLTSDDGTICDVLLVNGSMEADANSDKVPDFWKIKSPSGKSARKCDNPAKNKYYAHTGTCAVVLQSTGAKEVLQQTYTPAGGGSAGDQYRLNLWASGKSIPAGATVRAVVQFAYTDGTKEKVTLNLPTDTYAYQQFTLDVTASKAYTSVKVKIEYTASGGKLYVDDVSLLQTN